MRNLPREKSAAGTIDRCVGYCEMRFRAVGYCRHRYYNNVSLRGQLLTDLRWEVMLRVRLNNIV